MTVRRTKYYLDKRNARISGVCAGLADYTGLDPLWVRVGVVCATIFALGPIALLAYVLVAWLADPKPSAFYEEDSAEAKFWQGVRVAPQRTIRDVNSSFRDIDRRLRDIEVMVTSRNSRLANEIDALR